MMVYIYANIFFVLRLFVESLVIVMVKFVRKDRGGEGVNWSIFTL